MAMDTYRLLMAGRSSTEEFDCHLFACAVAVARQSERPLAEGLGLSAGDFATLMATYFPHVDFSAMAGDGDAPASIEEPDLRDLLLTHRTRGMVEERWLAAIVARRSLEPNHLWQDLGLTGRADLGRLMRTHFAPLAARNDRDMKWKKFFYRQLCAQEGIVICKSPICDSCDDFAVCFSAEDGQSLLAHAARLYSADTVST